MAEQEQTEIEEKKDPFADLVVLNDKQIEARLNNWRTGMSQDEIEDCKDILSAFDVARLNKPHRQLFSLAQDLDCDASTVNGMQMKCLNHYLGPTGWHMTIEKTIDEDGVAFDGYFIKKLL